MMIVPGVCVCGGGMNGDDSTWGGWLWQRPRA